MKAEIPFYTSSNSIDISDPNSVQQVAKIIKEKSSEHGHPALVIVDTLNRNFGAGDENSTTDMTQFINGLDRLIHELNTTIMVVHHTGLSNTQRGRGSSALKAAVDTEYRLDVDGDARKLSCTKSKDHEPPPPLFFKPEVINLGFVAGDDLEDMEVATSVVLNLTNSQGASKPLPKLTPSQHEVFAALTELCRESGNHRVHIDQWKEAALQRSIADTADKRSKNRAFKRGRVALLDKGYVATEADHYWVRR
ncbi:MAG: AAA family ATPase [Desulfuromusa sp.]|nr:AAA family ATPase [Desulfuromusa sp.]